MHIVKATEQYEDWLTRYTPLVMADVDTKHKVMASGPFPFLRATFYRWIQSWHELAGEIAKAPKVLAIGDIHIENYGTWRDAEGRLVWGINDFDEACILPYTQDLIRLIASTDLAVRSRNLLVDTDAAAEAILAGYTAQVQKGGLPFVVAEQHSWLRPIALSSLRDPVRFWNKMQQLPVLEQAELPLSAIVALEHMLPTTDLTCTFHRRVAGMGSLGHMRFVALAEHGGSRIAREAKALVPSALAWSLGSLGSVEILYQAILDRSIRCHDPMVQLEGQWIGRRLAPDCSKIEVSTLPQERDELHLLTAMGQELANVHLGTHQTREALLEDLTTRNRDRLWYRKCVDVMVSSVVHDFEKWKEH